MRECPLRRGFPANSVGLWRGVLWITYLFSLTSTENNVSRVFSITSTEAPRGCFFALYFHTYLKKYLHFAFLFFDVFPLMVKAFIFNELIFRARQVMTAKLLYFVRYL